MPRPDYKTCKQCGRHTGVVGELSHTRLCTECSLENRRAAATDLALHRGHYFRRWREGVAASVGAVLLDDVRENP